MLGLIKSLSNPIVKRFVKLQQKKSFREEESSIIIEGKKMVLEAPNVKSILSTEPMQNAYHVTPEIIQKISSMQTSDGIIAEVDMPKSQDLSQEERILILDKIQDPGNLGTLIRTAAAFGWTGIFTIEGSVDLFNPKVLRASMGAIFQLKFATGQWEDIKTIDGTFLAAHIEGKTPEKCSGKIRLILGSESHGVSQDILNSVETISLPMKDTVNSLNVAVAGGTLMYLL